MREKSRGKKSPTVVDACLREISREEIVKKNKTAEGKLVWETEEKYHSWSGVCGLNRLNCGFPTETIEFI